MSIFVPILIPYPQFTGLEERGRVVASTRNNYHLSVAGQFSKKHTKISLEQVHWKVLSGWTAVGKGKKQEQAEGEVGVWFRCNKGLGHPTNWPVTWCGPPPVRGVTWGKAAIFGWGQGSGRTQLWAFSCHHSVLKILGVIWVYDTSMSTTYSF